MEENAKKMKKKFLKSVVALTMSALSAVALIASGCGEKHTHVWGDKYFSDGDEGHYRVCDTCGAHEEVAEHEWGTDYISDGTDGHHQECSVCYASSATVAHVLDTYVIDRARGHYQECTLCDGVSAMEEHNYGTDFECDDCKYENLTGKYTALDTDDINDDKTIPAYDDVEGEAAAIPAPEVVEFVGNGEALVEGSFESTYEFDAADFAVKVYPDGWTDGIFSLEKGTEIRGRANKGSVYDGDSVASGINYTSVSSVKLDGAGHSLNVTISAPGELVFYVLNGSSGQTGTQGLKIIVPNGSTVPTSVNYPANGNSSHIQLIRLNLDVAGTYKIERNSGTSDIFYAKFTNTVENTPIERINLADTGKIDYIVGQQLDCTGLVVTASHSTTGRISPVDLKNVQIDTSKYDGTQAGTYEITVSYTLDGNLGGETTLTAKYNVNVYEFDGLELSFDKVVHESKNSAAGNGVYANHSVQQFYFVGGNFSDDGLTIKAIGKLGENTKIFELDQTQANVTVSTATAGRVIVKVEYTANGLTKAQGFVIYVAEKATELATADEIIVAVNPAFSSATVGTKNTAGAYRFKTVKQAMDFINNSGAKATAKKLVYIAEGDYWEKLEVTAPNVTFIGAGENKTKIEYDSLYGAVDGGGFTHTTDSTATLNVRDTAVGFEMYDLTVSNFYNTLASYANAPSNDQRALAVLIQADKVVVQNCTLLGFQDTLELFTGRQLFIGCLISGTTDYIFGTNNTTYFYKCEIRTIENGSKGGYCTAFKGNNKGTATDKVTYGAIFDDCDFTAEKNVPVGASSLGRAWGADAAVMVMNCRIGAHISKSASASTPGRYISMGSGEPSNAQFTEFNNTGAGAIDASLSTVKVLDATAAANYNNFAVIFGKTNGKVTYTDAWNVSLSDYLGK